VDFREQPGVAAHRDHYAGVLARGLLEMGGPYVSADSGGMMIPVAGLSEAEVRAIAAADPAVQSGLLDFEIRPWYVAMKHSAVLG
jgi:uncharacterized protein YciI